MNGKEVPPFSARNRGARTQIEHDFPDSARIGLLHLLRDLVELEYVGGWDSVTRELERIARADMNDNRSNQELLSGLPRDKVFDFCERLYSHLAQDVVIYHNYADGREREVLTPRIETQEHIGRELQRLFLEENLAFEFSGGLVRRRGRRHSTEQIARAELVLGDPRLSGALGHFNKALKFFRDASHPDYENAVKEAVCAVEATARALFPGQGSTLGDVVKSITGSDVGQLPKPIAQTFHGLYGFRNGGQGIGHGGATGGAATKEIAEYSLALAASQIVLLVDLSAASEPDLPF